MSNYEDRLVQIAKPLYQFVKQVMKEQPKAADDIEQYFGDWAYDGLQETMQNIDSGSYEENDDE